MPSWKELQCFYEEEINARANKQAKMAQVNALRYE